jgi:hypothetical protein
MGGLVALWCVVMGFFLTRIATPTHRHTFWSTVSGRQCVQAYFLKGATDEDKLGICSCNRLLWEGDLGSKVMEFTLQNWAAWERDKPDWFTPNLKASIPDEYMPRDSLAALGGAGRMRRGSAVGSVRESFRMIEAEEVEDEEEFEVVEEDIEENTKVEAINRVGAITGNDAEDVEEEKDDVMMEEGAVNIMSDID